MSWGPSRIREVCRFVIFLLIVIHSSRPLSSYHRSSYSITKETRPRNASPPAEGRLLTVPPSSPPLFTKLNALFFLRRMSFPLHDSDKLIKQTYSVYVFLPEDRGQDITRKWHLSRPPVHTLYSSLTLTITSCLF